ncbi:hypothetical protein PAEPH01_2860, partial [Pancytospora epiphaga]
WTIRETCRRLINILQEEEEQILETEQQLRKERINFESLENLMAMGKEEVQVKNEEIEQPMSNENSLDEFDNAAIELLCEHLSDFSPLDSDDEPEELVAGKECSSVLSKTCTVDDPHVECKIRIKTLEEELERYKKFSVACSNCQIINQKYKIQSQQLLEKQFIEMELERVKQKLRAYEDSDDSSVESASAYNIFGCLVQLYLDYCPVYSSKDIPRDEMLSLAHAIYFILGVFPEKAFHENLGICLDEINKRLSGFEENISLVAFVLSNLVELRVILTNSNDTQ